MSTKESIETKVFRFFKQFSKIWRKKARYKAERIGDRAKPCPTPTSTLKNSEEKLFQKYWVLLPMR